MAGIKVPGSFVPGTVKGYVTESKWVKGTYIVVQDLDEKELLPTDILVDGTRIYVVSEDREYRWTSGDWVSLPKGFFDAPVDGRVYARQNGNWTEVKFDTTNIEQQIQDLYTQVSSKADADSVVSIQEFTAFQEQIEQELLNYVTQEEIDGKISSLESQIQNVQSSIPDVSQFITNTADNLINYYTKTEVDDKISQITSSSFLVVDSLPQTGESNIIYLVAKSSAEPQNGYNEYIYVNSGWELIGETTIDLSGYVTSEQLTAELANYALSSAIPTALSQLTNDEGFVTVSDVQSLLDSYVTKNELETELSTKQDTLVSGTNIKTINGYSILGEGNIQIQGSSGGDISIATEDTVGGILATDNSSVEGVEVFVDVDDTGKASVKIPSVDETSTPDDVVNLLNTSTLILNGNA